MLITALLLLTSPATAGEAFPYSKADLERRQAVLREQQKAYEYALDSLPACDALVYFRNSVANSEPPAKTCPLAHAHFEEIQAWGRNLEDHCREIEGWADARLGESGFCPSWGEGSWGVADPIVAAVRGVENPGLPRGQLLRLTRAATGEDNSEKSAIDGRPEFETYFDHADEPGGELKSMDCALGFITALQYRAKANNTIFGHFANRVTEALDRSCRPNPPPRANLLDFMQRDVKPDAGGDPADRR